MENVSKAVKVTCFIINILLAAIAMLVAFSQYFMMTSHFGTQSIYAKTQARHIVVMIILSVCTFLVTRVKYLWAVILLSMVLTVILLVYFCIIVAIR